ncbi:fimbrillin family protein [Prevotella copri]|uniref:fimbrillin family protein n=1 Tax=Segatella copri TaxID=165179 RepID=UPI001C2BA86A|nr:fimbrillin family protein [Segatella copri]MBU9909168.1 fimbrillin family protein [Segatella copri]MBV3374685.1 fimbrillin family protein [Segatella copri]
MNLNYHKMKFLRLAFYVLIAQLVLSGCAGEAVEETSSSSSSDSSSSSEINFDAYVGRNASTRTSVTDIDFLKRDIKNPDNFNAGFGVFARYNHISLLDTEHVTWNKDQNHWEYTNTRYWPSEGSVDFYAFAPYSDVPKLNNNFEIVFPANWSPVDLVYANAENQKKADNPVKFTFKHALARLSFEITANPKIEEKDVVIKVKEVKLYGEKETIGIFRMEGRLNLKTGGWSPYDNGTRWFYTWTPDGNVEGEEDGKEDGEENNKKNSIIYKLSVPPQLDYKHDKVTNDKDSYIFIIPQKKPDYFNLKITYTVTQGDFEEEVTVYKDLLKVLPGDSDPYFKGGKAYVFHLILSLDPIDFKVETTVDNWGIG